MSKAILLNTGWTFTKESHDEPVTLSLIHIFISHTRRHTDFPLRVAQVIMPS